MLAAQENSRLSDLWGFDVNAKAWKGLPAASDPAEEAYPSCTVLVSYTV